MRRNSDDDEENPFGGLFDEINEMLSGAAGGEGEPVDVQESADEIRVVTDVPDASREEIDIKCDGRTLVIRVAGDPRPSLRRVDLPAYVDDEPAAVQFNNGILEVTLDREPDPADIGFH